MSDLSVNVDPIRPFTIWLADVHDWPTESRPEFTFRRLNGREFLELSDVLNGIDDKPAREACASLYEAFSVGLLGWKNQVDPSNGQPVDFDAKRLDEILHPVDAVELLKKRLRHARLTPDEKKS